MLQSNPSCYQNDRTFNAKAKTSNRRNKLRNFTTDHIFWALLKGSLTQPVFNACICCRMMWCKKLENILTILEHNCMPQNALRKIEP